MKAYRIFGLSIAFAASCEMMAPSAAIADCDWNCFWQKTLHIIQDPGQPQYLPTVETFGMKMLSLAFASGFNPTDSGGQGFGPVATPNQQQPDWTHDWMHPSPIYIRPYSGQDVWEMPGPPCNGLQCHDFDPLELNPLDVPTDEDFRKARERNAESYMEIVPEEAF